MSRIRSALAPMWAFARSASTIRSMSSRMRSSPRSPSLTTISPCMASWFNCRCRAPSTWRVLHTISADKDVDGFHLYNVGGLVVGGTVFPPCTPYGVLKLLEYENISLEGKNVVVVGASNIVGKPMALMLMQHEATVCICHAKTRDLAQFTLLADVLVVAAGYPNLILPQMVRTGAVVIDVGINRLADGRLVGDVDFAGVAPKASYITPVPGGVGPMTVSMLLINTINSCERWLRHMSVPVAKERLASRAAGS